MTLLLVLCFGAMSLLGSPLHQHDLDPLHSDPDCVPCHWSHSNIGLETDAPDLDASLRVSEWVSSTATVWFDSEPLTPSSRAPPVLL